MKLFFSIQGGDFTNAGHPSSEVKKVLKQLNIDGKTIKNIVIALYEAEVNVVAHSGRKGLDREISGGYVSDLLSDVMGNAREGEVWITLQVHQNVMAIASLKDLAAVILVNNLEPLENTVRHSEDENIPVLGTGLSTFEIAGKLYKIFNQ